MRKRGDGKQALLLAARSEFERSGYDGTNSNLIARAAGYAPQTFYRHFADKRAAFIAVYELWVSEELALLGTAATAGDVADILIEHHRQHRVFRRSLRAMSVADREVGSVRARARLQQAQALSNRLVKFASLPIVDQVATILTVERLCDAVADGEFEACGIDEPTSREVIITTVSAAFFD